MATEDLNDAPPPPSSEMQQSPLPDYAQLIFDAIEALNEPEGSSISAISKQIESTRSGLPDSFPTLISYHVNKMKQIGELVMMNDNYMKPSAPNAPPKRGRGRPPKSKEPLPPVTISSSPRSRGRPPKAKDPSAPPPEPKIPTGTGRPRGRPSKKPKTDSVEAAPAAAASAPGIKRGRGRPTKVKPAVAAVGC